MKGLWIISNARKLSHWTTGGASRENSARIIAEKKTIEKTKTLSRIAMGPEYDGMVQTDFFDGAMAVIVRTSRRVSGWISQGIARVASDQQMNRLA